MNMGISTTDLYTMIKKAAKAEQQRKEAAKR